MHWLAVELVLANVHVRVLKVPRELLAFHDTVPVGPALAPLLVSVTVTFRVTVSPAATQVELRDMRVLVGRLSNTNEDFPELLACVPSPE